MLYVNFLEGGGVLLEDLPQGEKSIVIEVGEEAEATLLALVKMESFLVCKALGELYVAGQRGQVTSEPAGY